LPRGRLKPDPLHREVHGNAKRDWADVDAPATYLHAEKENKAAPFRQFKSFAKSSLLWQSVIAVMKSLFACLSVLVVALSSEWRCRAAESSASPAEVWARLHFAGFEQLNISSNATTLKEVWTLPATAELRREALEKLARALAELFVPRADNLNPDGPRLILPLLDDLLRTESYVELKGQSNQPAVWTWALRLDEERIRLWQTNCSQLISGWNLKKGPGTNQISLASLNSWLVVALSPGHGGASPNWVTNTSTFQNIRANGRPGAAAADWLNAQLDLPKLAPSLRLSNSTNLPRVEISLSAKGSALRSQARFFYPERMNWRSEKWQIPTNTIRDPQNSLISFTAVQGFGPWLNRQPPFHELEVRPPNQFYAWGQAYLPFQIQAAFPVNDATNWLDRISSRWLPRFNTNLAQHAAGKIFSLTNRAEILWRGLPMIFPFLQPAPEPGHDYLWGGIFPLDLATNPPPAELLQQLTSRTNLLFYDWEITQGRIAQLRPLAELLSQVATIPIINTNSAGALLLYAIEPKLGNTITEIYVTSPRELALVRNSHIGLNGLELVTLAYWLHSPDFPKIDHRITFRPVRRTAGERKSP
jgi:hypothetical protein